MAGSAIISPSSFGDSSLPRLDLRPIVSIPGAAYDWASERLSAGPLEAWYDTVQNVPFAAPTPPSQKPVVYEGGRKVVRFNGADQRMDAAINLTGPRTLVVVGRFALAEAGQYMLSTGTTGNHNLYTGGNGKFAFYGTTALSSTKNMDTNTHVFLVSINGDQTVFSVDGEEVTGNPGTIGETALRMGSGAGKYFGVDVQRIALLPFAANAAQRAALVARLRSAYSV